MKTAIFISFVATAFQFVVADAIATAQNPRNGDTLSTYTYVRDVGPIIKSYCLTCHNSDDENPSELFMDDYAFLVKGGKHGATIVPGNPDSSMLYYKLLPNPPFGKQMPRGHKRITPEAVQIIHDWIQLGARKQ